MTRPPARRDPMPPMQPITIGPYRLTNTGLEVHGRPSLSEHQACGDFIERVEKASAWWAADWIAYGESRADWAEAIDALVDIDKFSEATVNQYRYVAKNVPPSRRLEGVSFSVHSEVASLDARDQGAWLEKARLNGWTQREIRSEIRAAKRTKVIDGQAALEGMFRVIYADPPWLYHDSGATVDGSLGKAERHYPGMTIADLCKLPVAAHALPSSILFMWVTAPMLYQNPGPREVMEAWGFAYKTNFTWDKVLGNYGHYSHVTHEHLIVATRGSCLPDVPTPSPKSSQVIRRGKEHSAKPDEFRRLIMTHWNRGPYLELFGRQPVKGWSVFGNDARLWGQEP